MSRDFISNLSLPLVRNVLSCAVTFKGNTDARSIVELADVLLRSEVYNELHHVNDSRNMADFHWPLMICAVSSKSLDAHFHLTVGGQEEDYLCMCSIPPCQLSSFLLCTSH